MIDEMPKLSVRIDFPNGTRFGPGKAALLKQLIVTGSIKAAAKTLEMSYPRALKLIEQMNRSFASPLVETQHGGASGGGALVTERGRIVLSIYENICERSAESQQSDLKKLVSLVAD